MKIENPQNKLTDLYIDKYLTVEKYEEILENGGIDIDSLSKLLGIKSKIENGDIE